MSDLGFTEGQIGAMKKVFPVVLQISSSLGVQMLFVYPEAGSISAAGVPCRGANACVVADSEKVPLPL